MIDHITDPSVPHGLNRRELASHHPAATTPSSGPGRRLASSSTTGSRRNRRAANSRNDRFGGSSHWRSPGEALAGAVEFGHGAASRIVGAVVAVRPIESGAEVDIHVIGETAWQRLAGRGARVDVGCAFTGIIGVDPCGGWVERVDID